VLRYAAFPVCVRDAQAGTPCLSGLDPGLFGAGWGIRRVGLRRVRPCRSVLRDRTARL